MKKSAIQLCLVAGTALLVGGICLSFSCAAPGVRDMSRQVGNLEYQQRMKQVLILADAGHAALHKGDYVLAEKKLSQSLKIDTTGGDASTWADLGRALDEQGRPEEAYSAYREAYASPSRGGYSNFPADTENLTHYAAMCQDNGQHDAAVRAYNKAVGQLNPRQMGVSLAVAADPAKTSSPKLDALISVMRGLTMREEKNLPGGRDRSEEAVEAFQEAARQQPNNAQVQYYLGYGYQKAGQFAAAQTAFGKAARLDNEGTVKAAVQQRLSQVQAHQR